MNTAQLPDVTSHNCAHGYPRATFRACPTLPAQPLRVARSSGQTRPTRTICAPRPLTSRQDAASHSPRLSCSSGKRREIFQNPSRRVSRFWNAPTPDTEYSVSGAPEGAGVDERSGQVCASGNYREYRPRSTARTTGRRDANAADLSLLVSPSARAQSLGLLCVRRNATGDCQRDCSSAGTTDRLSAVCAGCS